MFASVVFRYILYTIFFLMFCFTEIKRIYESNYRNYHALELLDWDDGPGIGSENCIQNCSVESYRLV